jgi:VCBS repeat protein
MVARSASARAARIAQANHVATADFNHDGNLDLAVAGGNGFSILRGLDGGVFSGPLILPAPFAHYWLVLGDFNNDGNVDLIGDGGPGQFYAGIGDGTFAAPVATVTVLGGTVAGDFNGDGKLDIISFALGFNQERAATQTISMRSA